MKVSMLKQTPFTFRKLKNLTNLHLLKARLSTMREWSHLGGGEAQGRETKGTEICDLHDDLPRNSPDDLCIKLKSI